jgi:hypothetical protein
MVRKRKRWPSTAEESDWLDRSSRRDGVVRRGQECDLGRSSRADEVEKRLSRAEESDWLDRSSRRDGVVQRGQECDQGRSSRADEVEKRLSRAEESETGLTGPPEEMGSSNKDRSVTRAGPPELMR